MALSILVREKVKYRFLQEELAKVSTVTILVIMEGNAQHPSHIFLNRAAGITHCIMHVYCGGLGYMYMIMGIYFISRVSHAQLVF